MTRKILVVLCSLLSIHTFAQFNDSFSDGEITSNPIWSGDVSSFIVQNDTLRSNGPESTTSIYLSTPSVALNNATWEFSVKLDFAPSNSNQVKIYLVSDNPNLTEELNGYYVLIGQSNEDQIKFFKQSGSVSTLLFTGSSLFSAVPVALRIKVDRDDIGNWKVFSDPSGGALFSSEGAPFIDDSFTSTRFFGVLCKHTSTRNTQFYFDDFIITRPVDIVPPSISTISPISITQVDVLFNEPISTITAETISNYSVNESVGNPISAMHDLANNSLVHLVFTDPLINDTNYSLTVQNIEDESGNSNSSESFNFYFLIPDIAEASDLLINEIMADPIPAIELPIAEFVEIYNRSNKFIDLANYYLNGSLIEMSSYIVAPEEYVILCDDDDSSLFEPFGNVIAVSSWNTLSNSGEKIILLNNNDGLIIDEVDFSISWHDDSNKDNGGYSLALINPNSLCKGSSNWRTTTNTLGGTPGTINDVYNVTNDVQAPELIHVAALNSDSVVVIFNEEIGASNTNDATFSIYPELGIMEGSISIIANTILIRLTDNIQHNVVYNFTVNGFSDCSGNVMNSSQSADFRLPSAPIFKDVIISEFMPDPVDQVSLPESEFVELYNRSNKYFRLSDFQLNGNQITTSFFELAPKSYIILCPKEHASEFENSGTTIGLTSWDALTNGGETLTLTDSRSGIKVDELAYSSTWYNSTIKNAGGWSLELIDSENLCSSKENWTASVNPNGGSPGAENSVKANKPDLLGPILEEVNVLSLDTLLLRFNENLDSISIHSAQYVIDDIVASRIEYVSLNQVLLILSQDLVAKRLYTLTINNLLDCNGNHMLSTHNSLKFALPELAEIGDIVLNELLFNPRKNAPDFVELYNTSDKYIDLQNWLISNKKDENSIDQSITISETPVIIAPQNYLVLTTDAVALANEYPNGLIDSFFEMKSMPSFPNDRGSVILQKPNATIYEEFDYQEEYHHALLQNVEGISLERINVNAPTNTPSNWHSAASTISATPGYRNSQIKGEVSNDKVITISPKVFIPNQNGFNDYATIHHEFVNAGLVVSILIIDDRGRLVKSIISQQTLPTSGEFHWDGTTEEGRKARIGSYMVYVETFDMNGNVKHYREQVVIGSEW